MLEASLVSECRDGVNTDDELSRRKKRLFLLCDSCYCSASALPTRKDDPFACPECHRPISILPLSDDESYRSCYEEYRNVDVEFSGN